MFRRVLYNMIQFALFRKGGGKVEEAYKDLGRLPSRTSLPSKVNRNREYEAFEVLPVSLTSLHVFPEPITNPSEAIVSARTFGFQY